MPAEKHKAFSDRTLSFSSISPLKIGIEIVVAGAARHRLSFLVLSETKRDLHRRECDGNTGDCGDPSSDLSVAFWSRPLPTSSVPSCG